MLTTKELRIKLGIQNIPNDQQITNDKRPTTTNNKHNKFRTTQGRRRTD